MSTSSDKKILEKRATRYLASSIFLIIFNAVYGMYANGVKSAYMAQAFLIPLIGGVVVCLLLLFFSVPEKPVTSLWRMGIVTLVVGSLLQGVFEIYGTEVTIVKVFFYVGAILLGIAFLLYLYMYIFRKKHHSKKQEGTQD